ILVDLPELVNPATREIVRRARQVFTVTTSEVLSLKLAELRAQELLGWGVEEARIQTLLNRWSKSDLAPKDVEKYLNRSIHTVFPNDYPAVRRATIAGSPFDGESEIGRAVGEFAAGLIGAGKPQPGGVTAKLKSLLKRS
ncbi:MAG: hypothetical protein MUC42_02940, partial [Bryobacter sp.]|nr:hypothetical protein [Bryobacter sp.]